MQNSEEKNINNNGKIENKTSNASEIVNIISNEKSPGTARYVVGVGASAGGLDALEQLFVSMPASITSSSGVAYIVVQHLSPDFKSLMDKILSRYTDMPVHRVENNMKVEANSIYLIPPRKNMVISNGRLILEPQVEKGGIQLPIDIFLKSLAKDYGAFAVGVILSGSGSDGSRGAIEINKQGGLVIAQDLISAKFDSMPRAVIENNIVDHIARPESIGKIISQHIKSTNGEGESEEVVLPALNPDDQALESIFKLLNIRYGIDFKYYRATTIDRRLERRINLTHASSLMDYANILGENPDELNNLYQDLLIGVTQFFRDPQAFEHINSIVYPALFESLGNRKEIRVWVAGCATGEEAYSITIGLYEYAEKIGKLSEIEIKVFATDVHRESLEKAAQGCFSAQSVGGIPKKILGKYFSQKNDNEYCINQNIRKSVVFAPQNLISDPPFTKIDFISCRNLLIYLESSLQFKVVSLFLFALRDSGYMFLGPSETLGSLQEEFDVHSSRWNIFSKRSTGQRNQHLIYSNIKIGENKVENPSPNNIRTPALTNRNLTNVRARNTRFDSPHNLTSLSKAYEALLTEYIDSGFLIDQDSQLLHVFGNSSSLMNYPTGRPSTHLPSLLIDDLRAPMSTAIYKALNFNTPVKYSYINFRDNNEKERNVNLFVSPLKDNLNRGIFLFCRIQDTETKELELESVDTIDITNSADTSSKHIFDLETELQKAREHLQATNEELETSNEELQATNEELVASNEELQSTNEELQSTNEELQSTNEELQSVNEELHTVNAEYQNKIEELTSVNNDLESFLRCTEVGTIFIDPELRVRRFSPSVSKLMNLLNQDIMRPLSHITTNINLTPKQICTLASEVFDSNSSITQKVYTSDGEIFMMKIYPYNDTHDLPAGVILTFINVSSSVKSKQELKKYDLILNDANNDLFNFAFIASHDLQTPLRHLDWYISKLSKSFSEFEIETKNKNLDNCKRHLNQAHSEVSHMRSLLNGLQKFTQIHTDGSEPTNTDFSCIVEDAIRDLAIMIDESGAQINYSLLPNLSVDKEQFRQLFVQLIQNSIQFCHNNKPIINISAEQINGAYQFSVSDNGVGIPKESSDIVFQIFKKLDSDVSSNVDSKALMGLGLAICKRIVNRHAGKIWLDYSNKKNQKGCVINFTVPN